MAAPVAAPAKDPVPAVASGPVTAATLPAPGAHPVGSDRLAPLADRIHDAALCCIARWGVAKTTLEDVAREAGCGRATIYRTIAGGKQALVTSLAHREIERLAAEVGAGLEAAGSLEEATVAVLGRASRVVGRHEAFRFLLAHEPDLVLRPFAFGRFDHTLGQAGDIIAPAFARWMPAERAALAAEWVLRVVVSHVLCPSPVLDLADDGQARRFVRSFLGPGLARLAADGEAEPTATGTAARSASAPASAPAPSTAHR